MDPLSTQGAKKQSAPPKRATNVDKKAPEAYPAAAFS